MLSFLKIDFVAEDAVPALFRADNIRTYNSINRESKLPINNKVSEFTSEPANLPAGAPRREIGDADTALIPYFCGKSNSKRKLL